MRSNWTMQANFDDKLFTEKQGQYLAFIYYYTTLNKRPPAERDMQNYFRVSPPTVHQMVKTLESKGLIQKQAGFARTIRLVIDVEKIPRLINDVDRNTRLKIRESQLPD